ncbi:MAG: shikimate kinase [Thaumarchaeota archaeon]|nr:shikimate kinase [Nitrososphaerota archaeon]
MKQNKAGVGSTHSAVSVVSALTTGKGATIGINIPCSVSVTLTTGKKNLHSQIQVTNGFADPHHLIETCVNYSLKSAGRKLSDSEGVFVKIDSQIPVAQGLKSSSAISVAVVAAMMKMLGQVMQPLEILKISCKASIASGASLTGAFDDAAACLLGGMVLSDNLKFRLLEHVRISPDIGSHAAILVPAQGTKFTSSIDRNVYRKFRKESEEAFRFAASGETAQAMLLNSIIQCVALSYSIRPVLSALSEGASASGISGKGPAVSALCRSSKIANRVAQRWIEENPARKVISAKTVQPKEIVGS